jgi:hypothetical protein
MSAILPMSVSLTVTLRILIWLVMRRSSMRPSMDDTDSPFSAKRVRTSAEADGTKKKSHHSTQQVMSVPIPHGRGERPNVRAYTRLCIRSSSLHTEEAIHSSALQTRHAREEGVCV